jgi:hypothetical protein
MIQKLVKNWMLILAGAMQAMFAAANLLMRDPEGVTLRKLAPGNPAVFLCELALAAGLCTIAAGIWSSGKGGAAWPRMSWLMALNGLALSAYGAIPLMWGNRPLSLRPYFALLLVAMATSVGLAALAAARALQNHIAREWLLGVTGAASVGFALAFLALDLRWINLAQPGSFFLLLAAFFGLSALCLLGMAVRLNGRQTSPA